jgi:uncharacterized OsmC-like protein
VARSVVVNTTVSRYAQEASVGPHLLLADEPRDFGGDDLGPNPYELLLAALGACTNMTLRMYAERKRWALEGVQVRLTHLRTYAEDCATCDTKEGMLDRIDREILLMEIADRCPIHRTLVSEVQISTKLATSSASTSLKNRLS